MVVHKVNSDECKGKQQEVMVYDCKYDWRILNNTTYPRYPKVMNMFTYRINDVHKCFVSLTYHLKPNKW